MSNIKVYSINQMKEIFTEVKDRVNSLQMVSTANLFDFSDSNKLFSFLNVARFNGKNINQTYTADKDQDVIVIGYTITCINRNASENINITSSGKTNAEFHSSKQGVADLATVTSNYTYDLVIKLMSLKKDDTVNMTQNVADSDGVNASYFLIYKCNSTFGNFYNYSNNAYIFYNTATGTNNVTINEDGIYLLISGGANGWQYNEQSIPDTNILINNENITDIDNKYSHITGPYSNIRITEKMLKQGDVVGLKYSNGYDWYGIGMIVIKYAFG